VATGIAVVGHGDALARFVGQFFAVPARFALVVGGTFAKAEGTAAQRGAFQAVAVTIGATGFARLARVWLIAYVLRNIPGECVHINDIVTGDAAVGYALVELIADIASIAGSTCIALYRCAELQFRLRWVGARQAGFVLPGAIFVSLAL
jgi:hypothetical protein